VKIQSKKNFLLKKLFEKKIVLFYLFSRIPGVPKLLENETLIQIGKKYNKTAAQVCLRWGVQKGFAVLAKSITPARIIENSQVISMN